MEGLNQVQPEGNDGKRRRDRDLSKADRHTALNNKHAGSKRKSRSRSKSGDRTRKNSRKHKDHHSGEAKDDVKAEGKEY